VADPISLAHVDDQRKDDVEVEGFDDSEENL
jgi:hypothetical protein